MHEQLNSLLLLSNADPLERKKDHSAYQVTEQVRSRELLKKGLGSGGILFMASSLGVVSTWDRSLQGRVTLLRVTQQAAVLDLPAPRQRRTPQGPVVGARYNSLDILLEVLEGLVPPDPYQEVGLGSFF